MRELVNIVWSENLLLGRLFISLVIVVSIIATVLAVYQIWRYRVFETSSLERLRALLQRWQKEQRGAQQELAKLDELKKATPPKSLIHHRLMTIERMRATNVKVDFEALQQITFAAESSQLGLRAPSFGVSFVLLLGLFGSVAGLCLTLPGLGQADADFNSTFGAMAASFSSGMAGLLGSIWISLVNLGLTSAQARFFEKFERFTVEELLPQTVPDIRNEAWLRQMHYKIGEAFERIKEIAEQNNQTVKEFEVVAAGFSRLVDSLEQSARKGASADVQKVLGQMGQIIGQVSRANDSALNLAHSVPQALEVAHTQNQNVLSRLDVLSQQSHEHRDKLAKLLTTTNENLPQTLKALQQSHQTMGRRIEEALSGMSNVTTAAPPSPVPAQFLKLLLYSVPFMFLLIVLMLLTR
jgi:biopolymer transport protein ExbB/TolQ